MALGSNAHADVLAPANDVAIQSAQTRKGVQREKNRLWIHDESYIGLLGSSHGVSRSEISKLS